MMKSKYKKFFDGFSQGFLSAGYGIAQMFSWLVWVAVGLLIAAQYGLTFSNKLLAIILLLGATGTYYYGINRYHKQRRW